MQRTGRFTLTDLLFPPKCACCGERLDLTACRRDDTFCPVCEAQFQSEVFDRCPECARLMRDCRCVPPLMKRAGCTEALKLFRYRPGKSALPTSRLVFRLKRNATRRSVAYPSAALAEKIDAFLSENGISYADVVLVWLPRSRRVLNEAGLDQAERLARGIATALNRMQSGNGNPVRVRCERCLLRNRTDDGKQQKELGIRERMKRMRNAFFLSQNAPQILEGKTVFLVDDLVTTGAGMAVCTKLLQTAGVDRVVGICLGRTYLTRTGNTLRTSHG